MYLYIYIYIYTYILFWQLYINYNGDWQTNYLITLSLNNIANCQEPHSPTIKIYSRKLI